MTLPIFDEQLIIEVTITGDAATIITGPAEGEMMVVKKFAGDLHPLDQELLLEALKHAIETHAGRVTFSLQETDYLIEGVGLEVKDRREGEDPPTPVAIVFIQQQ